MMIAKKGAAVKRQRVTFSYESAEAKEVFLMGDFNDWNPKTHPMKNEGKGVWKKTLMLSPEKYEYRFLVDGEWRTDRKQGMCPNCFGSTNNYIVVSPAAGKKDKVSR